MDIETGLVVLGSASMASKLLGPTCEYMGDGLKQFAEKRIQNVTSIFEHAVRKAGESIDEEREVNPKVLKSILDDGSYSSDRLAQEYFGGVLASSRAIDGRDDRGSYYAGTISQLTVYQLRLHYTIYTIFRQLYNGEEHNLYEDTIAKKLGVYIPAKTLDTAMAYSNSEDGYLLESQAITGLVRENLIAPRFASGGKDFIGEWLPKGVEANDGGSIFFSSLSGVELYLWAFGHGDLDCNSIFDETISLEQSIGVPILERV